MTDILCLFIEEIVKQDGSFAIGYSSDNRMIEIAGHYRDKEFMFSFNPRENQEMIIRSFLTYLVRTCPPLERLLEQIITKSTNQSVRYKRMDGTFIPKFDLPGPDETAQIPRGFFQANRYYE